MQNVCGTTGNALLLRRVSPPMLRATALQVQTLSSRQYSKTWMRSIWHAAHHSRHFVIELGYPRADRPVGALLYLLAAAGTLVTLGVVRAL